jgi:hypothetical protein
MDNRINIGMDGRILPRRRGATIIDKKESMDTHRFASIWTDGAVVGMMIFEKCPGHLIPISEWQSSIQNFAFVGVLKGWHKADPITSVIVNGLRGLESEQHPVRRMLAAVIRVEVVEAMPAFEGLAAYQESTTAGRLNLADYAGGERLIERLARVDGKHLDSLTMAFLQGIAREPKFFDYSASHLKLTHHHKVWDMLP